MEQFLDFWGSNPDRNSRAPDQAMRLYIAYKNASSNLASLKQQTVNYLIPIHSGKNLIPGFDSEKLNEVADLAASIEAGEKRIGAIARDIDEFMTLCEGPRFGQLSQKRRSLHLELSNKETAYKHTILKLTSANPEAIPSEIEAMPTAVTARGEWLEMKSKLEPAIAEATDRIEKAQRILAKH